MGKISRPATRKELSPAKKGKSAKLVKKSSLIQKKPAGIQKPSQAKNLVHVPRAKNAILNAPVIKVVTAPPPPRKSQNPYQIWAQKEGERLRRRNKTYEEKGGFGRLNKELGRLWKNMTPRKKQKFETMAEQDKVRYEREARSHKIRMARLGVRPSQIMRSMN